MAKFAAVESFLGEMERLCDEYYTQFDLEPVIAHIASCLVEYLMDPRLSRAILRDHNDQCVVAMSIYLALQLKGDPRSPRELSTVIGNVATHHIRATYDLVIYWTIIDGGLLHVLGETFNTQNTWPLLHRNELTARIRSRRSNGPLLGFRFQTPLAPYHSHASFENREQSVEHTLAPSHP